LKERKLSFNKITLFRKRLISIIGYPIGKITIVNFGYPKGKITIVNFGYPVGRITIVNFGYPVGRITSQLWLSCR
jgi:hypothetical protein